MPDTDGDAFSDVIEDFLGTDAARACPATAAASDEEPDAWPPDFDDSQGVDSLDFAIWKQHFPAPDAGDARYLPRSDLDASGDIDALDFAVWKLYFHIACG